VAPSFRARNSEQRVKVAATGLETYPSGDFRVAGPICRARRFDAANPKVLFEVLSPSTEKYDRWGKWEQYKHIETLTDYVLVDQDSVSVEHFLKVADGWQFRLYIRRGDVLTLKAWGFRWRFWIFTRNWMCQNRF
jgi:Uma2 family endonuclease